MNTSIDLQYGFRNVNTVKFCKATSLVAPGGGASPAIFHKMFLHMVGHLSVFVRYSEPIPTYIPGWGEGGGGSGFTLTDA